MNPSRLLLMDYQESLLFIIKNRILFNFDYMEVLKHNLHLRIFIMILAMKHNHIIKEILLLEIDINQEEYFIKKPVII